MVSFLCEVYMWGENEQKVYEFSANSVEYSVSICRWNTVLGVSHTNSQTLHKIKKKKLVKTPLKK